MYRKNISRITAIILAASMVIALAGCGAQTADESAADVITAEDEEQATLERTIGSSFAGGSEDADKVETVYVTTDAYGAVNDIIVSDWLKNTDGSSNIIDSTSLDDIVNVKGTETYTDNGDGTISWNAGGSDIYYQGSTDKELPVEVKVSYMLDGKEISPEEIAGKDGHVTIRFDYRNNAVEKVDIDGKEEEIKVPFAMVSGVMLDADKFSNVEVTNGKAISDANRMVVVGMALPGLKDSLQLDSAKLDELEDEIPDISIPDYVEINADTTDFELGMTLTMASADVLNDLGFSQLTDTQAVSDMEEDMSLLSDGTQKLVDGAGALDNGAQDLKAGTSQLYDGAGQLYDGTVSLTEGVSILYDGVSAYTDGASQVNDGAEKLADGAKSLADGANTAKEGSAKLRSSMEEANIVGGAGELAQGAASVRDGASALASGISQTRDGILGAEQQIGAAVQAGAATTATVTETLQAQAENLGSAGTSLQNAVSSLGGVGSNLESAAGSLGSVEGNLQSAGSSIADAKTAVAGIEGLTDDQKAQINAYLDQAIAQLSDAGTNVSNAGESLGNIQTSAGDAGNSLGEAGGYVSTVGQALTGLGSAAGNAGSMSVDFTDLNNALDALVKGANDLTDGASKVADGASALAGGVGRVYDGVSALDDGLGTLAGGAGELSTGASTLYDGTSTLISNNQALLGGVSDLKTGAGAVSDGAKDLYNGAGDLNDGAGALADGLGTLNSGIVKLDKEGIQKLSEAFDGSLDSFIDRVSAVDKAGREYTSFSGSTDDMTGSVKFIIKTEGVTEKTE